MSQQIYGDGDAVLNILYRVMFILQQKHQYERVNISLDYAVTFK